MYGNGETPMKQIMNVILMGLACGRFIPHNPFSSCAPIVDLSIFVESHYGA
jgi:hypothetical protein